MAPIPGSPREPPKNGPTSQNREYRQYRSIILATWEVQVYTMKIQKRPMTSSPTGPRRSTTLRGNRLGTGRELQEYSRNLLGIYIYIYTYIYLHIYICMCTYVYIPGFFAVPIKFFIYTWVALLRFPDSFPLCRTPPLLFVRTSDVSKRMASSLEKRVYLERQVARSIDIQ